jgi:threonine dehydrogenase-like Zn-dependent dehydrogenase
VKAILNTGPGRLEWREVETPIPEPGQVRIRTAGCGICATDLEMIAGWERTGYPATPGHEWSGWVDEVGEGVDPALVGRPCVAENALADGGEVGFEHPGGYGEYLRTEARNLHPLPDRMPLTAAALIEPLAVCVRAVRRWQLCDRTAALILGDGPIGLLLTALLKHQGIARVVLVGGRPVRLELARELGAAEAVDYHRAGDDLAGFLADLSGGPFANVAEASGSAPAAEAATLAVAPGGRLLVIGDYAGARAAFPWNRVLHRELTLIGSNASAGAWTEAVQLAVSGAVPLERLISATWPAPCFAEAIESVRRRRDLVKVVLTWT